MNPMPATGSTFRSHSNRPPPPGGSGFSKARTDLPGGCGGSVTVVPSGRVIVTGLAAVVPEGDSSRLLRAVRRLIGKVALQAVLAACRWRRHGLDFTAWPTSEATQDPGKVEIVQFVPRTRCPPSQVAGSSRVASRERARRPTRTFRYFAGALGADDLLLGVLGGVSPDEVGEVCLGGSGDRRGAGAVAEGVQDRRHLQHRVADRACGCAE